MNVRATDRERHLVTALAEALAASVGAILDRPAASSEVRETDRPSAGWRLRWQLGGPLAGRLEAVVEEDGARALARRGADPAPGDEAVAGALGDLADRVAGALNEHPAIAGWLVSVDGEPARAGLEPGAAALAFDVETPDRVRVFVTAGAALAEAPARADGGAAGRRAAATAAAPPNLGVILDLDLPLVVRFAQTSLTLQALSRLGPGSVLDLDRSPEEAVDVLVNGQTIARGQVVVAGGNYGVRITEVMSNAERMRVMAS